MYESLSWRPQNPVRPSSSKSGRRFPSNRPAEASDGVGLACRKKRDIVNFMNFAGAGPAAERD
jgi:hypothetical protein